jgi:hypothetical protein
MNTINKERDDLETLLPWHAAGTLNRRDAERVEKALASDSELQRRFNLAREELNETIHLNETLGAPSARAMEKLFAAIDAEPVRRPRVSFDLGGRFANFIAGFSPRTLAVAAAAGALAIVLQAGVITTGLIKHEAATEVASTQKTTPERTDLASADTSDGTLAAVRFSPKAEAGQITAFMLANQATMIDGPAAGGMFTIRLRQSGDEKLEHIKQMGQSPIVDFIASKQ